MNGFEKRLTRSNARYAAHPRVDLLRLAGRTELQEQAFLFPRAIRSGGASSRMGSAAFSAEPYGGAATAVLSIWLRLLTAHNLILREVRREFGAAVTLPQFDVLAQLDHESEGLTLVDLSRRLLVTAGNLTGIVARLQRDGLVQRRDDPADGRAYRIRLTQRGRNHLATLIPKHARLLAQLLDGLSAREQHELWFLLGRLGDGIVTHLDNGSAGDRRPAAGARARTEVRP